jgi:phage protein D
MGRAVKAAREFHQIYVPPEDYESTIWKDHPGSKLAPRYVLDVHKVGEDINFIKAVELGEKIKPFIKELVFEEDETMASALNITLNNPDFEVTNSEIFSAGNAIGLQFGYGVDTVHLGRRIELIANYPNFPEGGIPTIKVRGYDGRHRMTQGDYLPHKREENKFAKKSTLGANVPKKRRKGSASAPHVFKKKTDSEIIDEIAAFFDFAVDVDPTTKRRTRVKKKNVSYWQFILNIAKINNYTVWVDWDGGKGDSYGSNKWCLHFRKKKTKFDSGYVFEWRSDGEGTLFSAQLHEELTKQSTDIEVVHFDKKLRKLRWETLDGKKRFNVPETLFYKRGYDPKGGGVRGVDAYGANIKFRVGGRTIETISDKPLKSSEEAKQFAINFMKQQQEDYIVIEGTVVGTENLRPRQIHRLAGIGDWDGEYYFTQTRHRFVGDSIYKTEFIAYRVLPPFVYLHLVPRPVAADYDGDDIYGNVNLGI